MENKPMKTHGNHTPNPVRIAVDRVGGATKTANLLKVSNWTVHDWIRRGRVAKIDYATALAKASHMKVGELRPTRNA